jgi:hypothetical protein
MQNKQVETRESLIKIASLALNTTINNNLGQNRFDKSSKSGFDNNKDKAITPAT